MGQYRLDDHRVFNASDHPGSTTADAAGFHIYTEHPLESLCPRHCYVALRGRFLILIFCNFQTPLSRFAGVTRARCLLFGANTPWNRVRLTLGLGTGAASLAMKSTGSKMTCMDALMPRAQDAQERPSGSCHPDTGFSVHSEPCPDSSGTGVSLRSPGG